MNISVFRAPLVRVSGIRPGRVLIVNILLEDMLYCSLNVLITLHGSWLILCIWKRCFDAVIFRNDALNSRSGDKIVY